MFEEAAGLAAVAAFYPPAMLIAGLYLASARPGRLAALYVIGGMVIVTIVGTAALLAIRYAGLSLDSHHQTRYGLRLALGVIAVAAAVLIWRRRPKRHDEGAGAGSAVQPAPGRPVQPAPGGPVQPAPGGPVQPAPGKPKKPSLVDRLSAEPKPLTAFIVGLLMFGPSLTFIAAVQVVATSKASVAATVGAMAMIIVLTLAFAWLPLVAYLIAPGYTAGQLRAFEGWLKRHGKAVMVGAVALIGVLLIAQGISGLL